MKVSDRAIGYISIFVLICIFSGVAYGMFHAHQDVPNTILVDFDELGTLQPEDVVVIRGYRVGTIGSVTWLGDKSRIQIKFDEPIVIREGTEFNNVNYALMGQRRLEILPSKVGKVLPKDYIHKGHFEPGIAEVLRYMEDVNAQIMHVREVVMLIANGDSTHVSAKQKYEEIASSIESLLLNIEKSINSTQPKIKNFFNQIQSANNSIIDITLKVDTSVKIASENINEKIAQIQELVQTLSEGTKKTKEAIASIEKSQTLQNLLNTKNGIDKINEFVAKTNNLIKAIDTKGIKVYDENGNEVKLITWKKTNLIGKTAREKANERAKNGTSLPITPIKNTP